MSLFRRALPAASRFGGRAFSFSRVTRRRCARASTTRDMRRGEGSFPEARARGDATVTAGSRNRPQGRRTAPDEKTARTRDRTLSIARPRVHASPVIRADEGTPSFDAETPPRAPRGSRFPPHSFSTRDERLTSSRLVLRRVILQPSRETRRACHRTRRLEKRETRRDPHDRSATARSSVFLIPSCGP